MPFTFTIRLWNDNILIGMLGSSVTHARLLISSADVFRWQTRVGEAIKTGMQSYHENLQPGNSGSEWYCPPKGSCFLSGNWFPPESAATNFWYRCTNANKDKSSSGWMHHWTPPRSSRRRGRPSAPRPEPGASSRGFRSAGSRPARSVLRTSRDNAAPSRMKGQSSSVLVGLCERERGDLMAVF